MLHSGRLQPYSQIRLEYKSLSRTNIKCTFASTSLTNGQNKLEPFLHNFVFAGKAKSVLKRGAPKGSTLKWSTLQALALLAAYVVKACQGETL